MPYILSAATAVPPHRVTQQQAMQFAGRFFRHTYSDLDRLLQVFSNGQIAERYFAVPLNWFTERHSFQERNDLYIKIALELGRKVILNCLQDHRFFTRPLKMEEVDMIIFVSSTGLATPSLDARLIDALPFSPHTKRMPLWGLGCAGGAAGLARAYEYCRGDRKASVLVVSLELCSLTFQSDDMSKSNLIGTSLFADGAACVLVCGDASPLVDVSRLQQIPAICAARSALMPGSESVMGWDVRDNGFYVVFSRDIPHLVRRWFKGEVKQFLHQQQLKVPDIARFVAHPGGKKVLDAYEEALHLPAEKTAVSRNVLRHYGNMSSPTIFFVMYEFLKKNIAQGEYGLAAALGPGFSSELLLLQWKEKKEIVQ